MAMIGSLSHPDDEQYVIPTKQPKPKESLKEKVDNLVNNLELPKLKVNLGDTPCLLLEYFGRIYKVPREVDQFSNKNYRLKTSVLVRSKFVVDELCNTIKSSSGHIETLQKYIDYNSLHRFEKFYVVNLMDKTWSEIYEILNEQRLSIQHFQAYKNLLSENNVEYVTSY